MNAAHSVTAKGVPGLRSTRLREIRAAAGWKQAKLLQQLELAGPGLDVVVPPRASLKRQVSRWENGAAMSEDYRRLFCTVYGKTETELGFGLQPTAPAPALATAPAADTMPSSVALTVSPEVLRYLRNVLVEYAQADNLVGPHHLRTIATGQLDFISQLLRSARGSHRTELLNLAARFAEFAGWLHQDAGDLAAAAHWSGRATEYAQEIADPWLTSYVFMRRSNIATDMHDPGAALGLADAALREGDRLTPGLRAVALRQRAHAAAMWQDRDDCARAIDAATTELVTADPGREESDLTAYCTPAYIAMETASCWVQLGEPERAVPIYQRGLADWPAGLERDRGLCLSRLAVAHAVAGDSREAAQVAKRAATAVRSAPSARAIAQLRTVRATIGTRESAMVVSDVDEALAGLI